MTKTRHPQTGCIDGFLPISPIDRRPSAIPCGFCEEETRVVYIEDARHEDLPRGHVVLPGKDNA